ncbi:Histone H2A.1 [Capsicum annuum]|uniref:Histone H2A.1 n=1 Tax=Capsicum annuum TaxID=4072 RepID=A0A2G2YE41_CAPAN|nr:Histone H2A.1 [Capsicum annuum]KAF3664036.1 Histone H2A.1 [Capsicum annuum]PHT68017.1 Histone H2A.1 [Capsicum annuum]
MADKEKTLSSNSAASRKKPQSWTKKSDSKDKKKSRIMIRHIKLIARHGKELNMMLDKVTIATSGVIPNNHNNLLSNRKYSDSSSKVSAAADNYM